MRIQNNITAMNTHRQYTINNDNVSKAAEKLSSGYRINRAGDDAAGLAISEKMRSQIRGLNMATKNSQDAISLVQTAEGALQETHSMLQRMNELAVQAATGTNQQEDRLALAKEFEQLKKEINDVAEQTTFNNMKVLDGSLSYATGYQRSAATSGVTVASTVLDDPATKAVSNDVKASASGPQRASFKIELGGTVVAGTTADPTITISDGTNTATLTGDRPTTAINGSGDADLTAAAQLFDGKSVQIDGITYVAKADGKTLTFTQNADPTANKDITAGTWTATGVLTTGTGTVSDVTEAKVTATTPEENTVKFTASALKVGDKITVGGKTVEVVKDAAAAAASTADGTWVAGGTESDLIDAIVATNPTGLTFDDTSKANGVLGIKQTAAGTGSTNVALESSNDGKKYQSTIEFDAAKMKDGDKFKVTVGGQEVEVEFKEATHKTTSTKTSSELFAEDVAKALVAKGVTVTQKGNAITFKGDKVSETDLILSKDATAGVATNAMRIQVGALEDEQLAISIDAMNTKGLGLDGFNLDSQNSASMAITAVRSAVEKVSDQRATLGAMQNRLDHKIANLKVSSENLSAAESRIRDVDMASEMTNFTKNNILSQAATAMLAQANALPQNVLSLLG